MGKCVHCGRVVKDPKHLLCDDCDILFQNSIKENNQYYHLRCTNCGTDFWTNKYEVDVFHPVCPECTKRELSTCEKCGSKFKGTEKCCPKCKSKEENMSEKTEATNKKIVDIYNAMADMQVYKNTQYGNIGSDPLNIFARYMGKDTPALNGIYQRCDDKLSRIKNNPENKPRVNDIVDLMGYLNLLLVNMDVTPEDIAKFKD